MSQDAKAKIKPIAVYLSRQLRRTSTKAEKIFWDQVKNRKFLKLKFRRQHPILVDDGGRETFYVADFYCHEKRLVIEIDGEIHLVQTLKDGMREHLIQEKGLHVKRFTNAEVEEDIETVMEKLEKFIKHI